MLCSEPEKGRYSVMPSGFESDIFFGGAIQKNQATKRLLDFFYPLRKQWYIITRSVYIISRRLYTAFAMMIYNMICNSYGIDDIQGFALIYSPKCSIILLEGSDIMAKNYLLIYSEQLATEIELLCQNLKAPSNTLFQIRKSSSSVYANIREANYGQSKSDMISKFEISLKECTETEGWLKLLFETNIIDEEMFRRNRNLCGRIRRMLISSCKTLKDNK